MGLLLIGLVGMLIAAPFLQGDKKETTLNPDEESRNQDYGKWKQRKNAIESYHNKDK